MTLQEYLRYLGWNISTLARQAGINDRTASKAVNGQSISPRAAQAIASALSDALGRTVYVGDIHDLKVG